jgi:hypothetical protein
VKATTFGIVGSLVINLMLGVIVAAVFSVTPAAQAHEVAQCPMEHAAQPVSAPAQEREQAGGHLVAVRMGWEAG